MQKRLCLLISVLFILVLLPVSALAAAPEVKINDTISYEKQKQLSHTNTGNYPVFESTYTFLEIDRVTSLNDCAKVEKTFSGWIVTFVKAGNARIEVVSHVRESYSKYNTEEQKVYSNYNKNYASETKVHDYKVISMADAYVVPDGYVGVYKDGLEYIDFASQEVINAKFGNSTLIRYANLQNFFGFSYKFENNTFTVTLDNFTGNGLYFRCPKNDTAIVIYLKGKNTLTGTTMAFNKEAPLSAIAATGSKSAILVTASDDKAELNVDMKALPGKNDSASVTRYVPFYAPGGTQVMQIVQNCRPTVSVNLTTDAHAVGDRSVNLTLGDLSVADADFNYAYATTGCLKNYSGVAGRLLLDREAVFTGTLDNAQTTGNAAEYLFPKITYASGFQGGAYFECKGGKLIKDAKNEVFIPNTLLSYEATADKTQYRAVTAANDGLLTRVDPALIAPAFPEARVNQALPALMDGKVFKAGLSWTDEANKTADYAEKNHTYTARAAFVPMKGYYVYVRNLTAADKAKAKPACVWAVYNINLPNTTTTRYDALDFRLHKIQAGSPTITSQPASALADPGETVYFNVSAINTNPAPDGFAWYAVSNVSFLGVTIPWPTKLSDNAVYSGTDTASLKVNVNSSLYKIRYFYCKVNGTGWESVQSAHVTITQPKRINRIALGGDQDPLPGQTPDRSYAYGFDYDNIFYSDFWQEDRAPSLDTNAYTSSSNSPAAKLDYQSSSSETDGCFWYKGESSFSKTPAKMSNAETFAVGGTYTYRFRVLAKAGYKFADNAEFTHNDKSETVSPNVYRVSDTEYLVDFTYKNITWRIPTPGEKLIFRDVPVVGENGSFTESASVQDGAGYTLTAQEGWLDGADENAKAVIPQLNGIYYVHYTLVAKEGYSFSSATSAYTSTCYNADDGKSISFEKSSYVISDQSNTTLEVYLGFKCTQKRVKDLTLKGLAVPAVGSKLGLSASADPAGVAVTAVKYFDMGFNELSASYVPKAKDMLTVSVFVKGASGVSFDQNATMTWTVTGNKLSANGYKDAGMADNERRFDFNVSVHEHEWTNSENAVYLKEAASCLHGTIYYQSCVFCEAQGPNTFEMDDKNPHAGAKVAAKAATCTAAGNKEYYQCGTCMKLFSDAACTKEIKASDVTVNATGHKWGAWTKLNDTQHQRVCSNDKTHVEKANHTWDAGKVTKSPTTTETGVKTFTCTVCKGTKTESIPKTAYLLGDVDLNGKVEAGDARLALRRAVGLETFAESSTQFKAADADKNGKVEAGDARLILRAAVGLELLG